MSQETLRGTSLGMQSFESEENVIYADRKTISFECANNHITEVVFAEDAEIPEIWQCRICSTEAHIQGSDSPAPEQARPGRSHWQMLLERRTVPELEEILNEQLTRLRERRANGQVEF